MVTKPSFANDDQRFSHACPSCTGHDVKGREEPLAGSFHPDDGVPDALAVFVKGEEHATLTLFGIQVESNPVVQPLKGVQRRTALGSKNLDECAAHA